MERNGDFDLLFSDKLLGLVYLKPLGVDMKTKGTVSELYADEEGPISESYSDLF